MIATVGRKAARRKVRQQAPKVPAPPAPDVRMIPLSEIERDGQNHRLASADDQAQVKELADSFNSVGQRQPVEVFEYPAAESGKHDGHSFVLSFGFRRCAAAEVNGWTTIAATVRPMPLLADGSIDRLAIERIRAVENLQRDELNPIEECLLVAQLAEYLPAKIGTDDARDEHGTLTDAGVQLLANSIGRSESWIRDRMYLQRLSPAVKQMVIEGVLFLRFAREIAKLADQDEQERVAAMCKADPGDGHCSTSIHQVRRYVAERENALRGVPWQIDKAFPQHKTIVGPCSTCRFNSTNDKRLFEHDDQPAPEGFCLNPGCFSTKRALTDQAVEAAVQKIVSTNSTPTETTAAEVAPEFVKPGRVARQARKQIDGGKPMKPAKLQYWEEPAYKSKLAFAEAERAWKDDSAAAIFGTFKTHPGRLIALLLIAHLDVIRHDAGDKEIEKIRGLLKLTVKPTQSALLQLERRLLSRKHFGLENVMTLHGRELVLQAIAKLYGVELPALPKLEDFLPQEPVKAAGETDNGKTASSG